MNMCTESKIEFEGEVLPGLHAARVRFHSYRGASVKKTSELMLFSMRTQKMSSSSLLLWALTIVLLGNGMNVKGGSADFDQQCSCWEPLANILENTPQHAKVELREIRLYRGVRARLHSKYRINLWISCGFNS